MRKAGELMGRDALDLLHRYYDIELDVFRSMMQILAMPWKAEPFSTR